MQGKHLAVTFRIAGTLSANHELFTAFPFDVSLVGVTAYTDNTTSFILDVGSAAAKEAYIKDVTVTGVTDTVTTLTRANMVSTVHPHIAANTVIVTSVDFDGGAGGDSANVGITLHFTEG